MVHMCDKYSVDLSDRTGKGECATAIADRVPPASDGGRSIFYRGLSGCAEHQNLAARFALRHRARVCLDDESCLLNFFHAIHREAIETKQRGAR